MFLSQDRYVFVFLENPQTLKTMASLLEVTFSIGSLEFWLVSK